MNQGEPQTTTAATNTITTYLKERRQTGRARSEVNSAGCGGVRPERCKRRRERGREEVDITGKAEPEDIYILFTNVDTFSLDKHIIALQEVKPKNARHEKTIEEYSIKGYEIITHNLETIEGRGLLLYVKKDLSAIMWTSTQGFQSM